MILIEAKADLGASVPLVWTLVDDTVRVVNRASPRKTRRELGIEGMALAGLHPT